MSYPSFSAGDVLTATDMNAVGLWKITSGTLGTGTLSFNGCFTSSFTNYRVVLSNIKTAAPGSVVINLRKNNTDNGNDYYYGGLYRLFAGGAGDTVATANNFWLGVTASNTIGASATFDIYNPQVNTYTQYGGVCANFDAGTYVAGVHQVTDQFDGISFIPYGVAGASGTITIYGYRN